MSIFKKALGWLIRPIIKMEVKHLMKDFIQPLKDLVLGILERKRGTKLLATVAALGAIVYLHTQGVATTTSDIVVGAILVAYYVADILAKKDYFLCADDDCEEPKE